MRAIPQQIIEQVDELERLRAAGCIDDVWYRKTRAAIVRASRRAATDARSPSPALHPALAGPRGERRG